MGNIGVFSRFHDGDDVKAYPSEYLSTISEVYLGGLSHATLFDGGHGFYGSASGKRAAHLDLDKDQRCPVEGDKINFAPTTSEIALENVVTAIGQVISCRAFALAARSRSNAGSGGTAH